jgi:hypothetical protein
VNQVTRVAAVLGGGVEVASRRDVMGSTHWSKAFASEAKDRRYYELVEDTIHKEFDYWYFVVRDWKGEICAIQPFFLLDLDLLVGAKPRIGRLTDFIRRFWPRFMHARTLMVGCAAGEGHLDGQDEFARRSSARLLASALVTKARELKARLIVLKEFHAKYRSALECFVDNDFVRIPSLPNVMLDIDYSSFEEYITRALSGGARRKLRLKLKAADQAAQPIKMSVVDDVTRIIDQVYPLYLQVYNRSSLHFEKLTKEYFCALGHQMGEKNRFFIWRQNEKIVAFGSCLLQGDMIHAEYLGLDYTVALDLHLYHYTFRDLIVWGIANGYKRFHSSALNYDPKLHLRYRLDPIDLYVRHTSKACNAVFRRILPWIEPTRYEKTLRQFANYDELWAPTGRARRSWAATASVEISRAKQAVVSAFAGLRDKMSAAARRAFGSIDRHRGDLGTSLKVAGLVTAALVAVNIVTDIPHFVFAYLLPISYVAIKFGRMPAMIATAVSGLYAAYFLYEPLLDFDIDEGLDRVEMASFFIGAFIIVQLLSKRSDHGLIRQR